MILGQILTNPTNNVVLSGVHMSQCVFKHILDKVTVTQSLCSNIQFGLDMMREILIGVPDGEESFG